MRRAHPAFQCAIGVFNRRSTDMLGIWLCHQPGCGALNDFFMDPTAHASILSSGALRMDGTGRTRRTPVAPHLFATFRARKSIDQALTRRTLGLIVFYDVMELRAIELTFRLIIRCRRVRDISGDVTLFTGSEFLATVVAPVSEHMY